MLCRYVNSGINKKQKNKGKFINTQKKMHQHISNLELQKLPTYDDVLYTSGQVFLIFDL